MDAAPSHTSFDMRWAVDPKSAAAMDTAALRANFLVEKLFEPGKILLSYTHYDRMVVGGAMPVDGGTLTLTPVKPIPQPPPDVPVTRLVAYFATYADLFYVLTSDQQTLLMRLPPRGRRVDRWLRPAGEGRSRHRR